MVIDESQLSNEFIVCDNVDLETIYLEFCSYYHVKFGRKPRFVKRTDPNVIKIPSVTALASSESRQSLAKRRSTLKTASNVSSILPGLSVKDVIPNECLRVSSLSPPTHDENNGKFSPIFPKPMSNDEFFDSHPSDWKEMTEIIFKDVVQKDLCVKWDDVMGQDDAKQIIQESVILPIKYPQLFAGVQPWKGELSTHKANQQWLIFTMFRSCSNARRTRLWQNNAGQSFVFRNSRCVYILQCRRQHTHLQMAWRVRKADSSAV
jgi:katanin p60 ATPase-containing subunit A1